MIIRNFEILATTPLRKQALLITEAGLQALSPDRILENKVNYDPRTSKLQLGPHKLHLKDYKNIVLAKIGAAAAPVTGAIKKMFGHLLAHNIEGEHEVIPKLETLSKDDLVIVVVADDGQSLYHPALPSYEGRQIIGNLQSNQATAEEINTVRFHLSHVLGGNVAKASHPATVITLVYGNDNGVTIKDNTTTQDAAAILQKYNVLDQCGLPSCQLWETPKDDKYFRDVRHVHLDFWNQAFAAMASKMDDLSFPQKQWQPTFDELRSDLEVDLPAQLWYSINNKFR